MNALKISFAGVCVAAAASLAPAAGAQGCNSSQDAAVECFVSSAVRTNLTSLRYGMNMTEFKAYGVAVSKILQSGETPVILGGVAAAVADAMPPTNSDGSSNTAAQQAAITAIVNAEVATGLVTLPAETTQQDLTWFTEDLADNMSQKGGIVMSPGLALRILDTYITSATTSGTVNWTQVNTNIAGLVNSLQSAGLLRLPAGITTSQLTAFAQSVAQAIYTYTQATGRASL